MRPIVVVLLLAAACSPAKVAGTIDGGGDSGASDQADGADGADGSDGADGTEEIEASTADWAGSWTGGFDLVAGTGGEGGTEYFSCEGDLTLEADDDGVVTGDGGCEVDWVGTIAGEFAGTFTADGDLVGVFTVAAYGQTIPVDAVGGADDEDTVSAYLDGELEAGGYALVIGGSIEVVRQ